MKDYKELYEQEKKKNKDILRFSMSSKEIILNDIAAEFGEEIKEETFEEWDNNKPYMTTKKFYHGLWTVKKEFLEELLIKIRKAK